MTAAGWYRRSRAQPLTESMRKFAGTGGHSLIPFGRIHPASRSRVAGTYGILRIVPSYPSLGRWVQAFKTTDGQTLDRVQMSCH